MQLKNLRGDNMIVNKLEIIHLFYMTHLLDILETTKEMKPYLLEMICMVMTKNIF